MVRGTNRIIRLVLSAALLLPGCAMRHAPDDLTFDPALAHFQHLSAEIEYPDVESCSYAEHVTTPPPITIDTTAPPEYWDLSLHEAIQIALAHSAVLKDLGSLLHDTRNVQIIRTAYGPAITETDPQLGIEAALSAFDASFEASAFFEKNDRALNNVFFGGGTRILQQDLHRYQSQISKRSATGGEFTARKIFDYDANNSPGNNDPALPWGVQLEGEFRQPLFQGAGVDFNRIAGPGATPGNYNGVVIARVRADVSQSEFEIGVRSLVNAVENLYWELYFAYRDLDAKIAARNRALQIWRSIENLRVTGRRGGDVEQEALAREQYFRLEEEVQNALTGRPADRVRSNTFRGAGGVHSAERRLRLLMGIPVTDGRLIRPSQEPLTARIVFAWEELVAESLTRRPELRLQKWLIKESELELAASKNFLLPRVDAVGRYRFRGLGHDLTNAERQTMRFDNAVQDLTTGDFQEWQLGVEVELPFGFRRAHAAVRHAELQLTRRQAILDAQEQEVVHDLSAAFADVQRSYATSQTTFNRRLAAQQALQALDYKFQDADEGEKLRLFDLLLNAQRRLTEAEAAYYHAQVEYTLAVKNVHLQKGSLLDYNEIYLAEGPWPEKAYDDDARRASDQLQPPPAVANLHTAPRPVSRGPYGQRTAPTEAVLAAPPHAPEEVVPTPGPIRPGGNVSEEPGSQLPQRPRD